MYIIRHFEFSIAYPLISISYVWGVLAAIFIFHENIPPIRFVGVALIVVGVICIVQK
jgi:undecaprenyl phosphate-alpha-L-ara4N flippase subunit ArnE